MGNPLRDLRTPSDLAESCQVIEFTEKISEFEHLERIVEADLLALEPDRIPPNWRDSVVSGTLTFKTSGSTGGLPALDGRVAATLDAVCQRCLRPFRLPIATQLRLVFAAGEGANEDGDGYEVWELEQETVRPLDLVEEALIMAMPFSAMHTETAGCITLPEIADEEVETTTPFAGLKAQMDSKN